MHGHVLIQLGGKGSQKWMQHIASHFHNDIIRLLVGGLCDAEDSNILPAAVLLQPINLKSSVPVLAEVSCRPPWRAELLGHVAGQA